MPAYGNARLRAQRGVFTLYDSAPVVDGNLVSQGALLESRCLLELADRAEAGIKVDLEKHSLAASEARRLLELLARQGTTTASMFTGYEGAAMEVVEQLV